MTQIRPVYTDDAGARAIGAMITEFSGSESGSTKSAPPGQSQQVVVQFLEDIEPGDYTPKLCALMRLDGSSFVDTMQRVPVRFISSTGLKASAENPVQVIARATGILGLCAEKPAIELFHGVILEQCNAACSTYRVQRVHRYLRSTCDEE